MTDDTSHFTFISHDEGSKERKHRLYSHSRNAAIRNKRRAGREALRPARPLPVKDLTLRPPNTAAHSSASTTPTTSRPSPSAEYSDSTIPSVLNDYDAESNTSSSADLLWGQTHIDPLTQPVDNNLHTGAELCETYPDYLPALDPDSYAMMLYDTSLGAFEESTSLMSFSPERQSFVADHDSRQRWLQIEDVHDMDGVTGQRGPDSNPDKSSSIVSPECNDGTQTSRKYLFFGLDLEGEHMDDDAIRAAFELQSAPIDQYNENLLHTTFDDANTATETTQRNGD